MAWGFALRARYEYLVLKKISILPVDVENAVLTHLRAKKAKNHEFPKIYIQIHIRPVRLNRFLPGLQIANKRRNPEIITHASA